MPDQGLGLQPDESHEAACVTQGVSEKQDAFPAFLVGENWGENSPLRPKDYISAEQQLSIQRHIP